MVTLKHRVMETPSSLIVEIGIIEQAKSVTVDVIN